MNKSLEKLDNDKIITPEELRKIKFDLENKYRNVSEDDRAKLFSKKINNIVNQHLDGLNPRQRRNVRKRVVRRFALAPGNEITIKHLFDEVSAIHEHDNNELPVWTKWIELYYGDEVSYAELGDYVTSSNKPVSHSALCLNQLKKYLGLVKGYLERKNTFLIITVLLSSFFISYFLLNSLTGWNSYYDISFMDYAEIKNSESDFDKQIKASVSATSTVTLGGVPDSMKFKPLDYTLIANYLDKRNSMLTTGDYLDVLINTAIRHNINPIVLISIAGQEQGFIPKDGEYSSKIIKNPYNVFGSWKQYSTTFEDSTDIAARTVSNILSKRPVGVDPFIWLNETYAEDDKWHVGVQFFFDKLSELSEDI